MRLATDDVFIEDGLWEMENILKRAEVGRIAVCDGLIPYVVPMNFLYSKGKIVFHCAWKGKKLDLIIKNPNCCFEVDEFMGKISYHYKTRCNLDYDSVLAFGKARIENNEAEKLILLQLFAEKYDELYRNPLSEGGKRFEKTRLSECCCVIIDVEELTGRQERTVVGDRQKTWWRHRF